MYLKTCPLCKEQFIAKVDQQKFCSKQHADIYYYRHKRNKTPQEYVPVKWCCPKCGREQWLTFNPLRERKKLEGIRCECGFKNNKN